MSLPFSLRVCIALVVWGFLALGSYAGPASPELDIALASGSIVVVASIVFHARRAWVQALLGCALAGALPILPPGLSRTSAYVLAAAILLRRDAPRCVVGVWLSALTFLIADLWPTTLSGLSWMAGWVGSGTGEEDLAWGPTAGGVWPFLTCMAVLATSVGRAHVLRPIACMVGCVAWWLVQVPVWEFAHENFGPWVSHRHPLPLFSGLWVTATGFAVIACLGARGASDQASPGLSRRRTWATVAVSAAVVPLLLLCSPHGPSEARRSVAFLNAGGLDWDRPQVEEIGSFSSGMFGLLPVYLERQGWEVSTVDLEDAENLGELDAQVLVLINLPHVWSDAEREAVHGFLSAGGSLLVLGDHTDVYGLMTGFNSLIGPYGIRYRFDSARFEGSSWFQDLVWNETLHGIGGNVRAAFDRDGCVTGARRRGLPGGDGAVRLQRPRDS